MKVLIQRRENRIETWLGKQTKVKEKKRRTSKNEEKKRTIEVQSHRTKEIMNVKFKIIKRIMEKQIEGTK